MANRQAPAKVRGVYERDPGTGIWWIQYKQGSVRKREKVGRRSDAIALYQQRKTELRAGAKLVKNLRHKGTRFAELAGDAEFWSAEHHPKDIRNVKSRMATLKSEFGDMVAAEITPHRIEAWLTEHVDWAPATKNRYRALLSLVFRQAMRNGKADSNPARLVGARPENNARIRYLLDEEEAELRKAMAGRYDWHAPILDVALHTGMRLSEQFTLSWDQVDLTRREITLDETKNGSSRTIPLNAVAMAAFRQMTERPHLKTGRVFRSARGEAVGSPRAWFTVAIKDAGIKKFRWHDLRHTFCSRLAMAGVDIRTIAQLAGHKTLAMAMRYSHLSPSHNLSAIERLTQPLPWQGNQPGQYGQPG